jgi:prolyl 4-hydroxylase
MNPSFYWPASKSSAIMVAEDIINSDVCDGIIRECGLYYSSLFSPGPVVSGIFPSIKSSMDFNWSEDVLRSVGVPHGPLTTYEHEVVSSLWVAIAYYRENFRWLWDWEGMCDTGFRLQHYKRGIGHYREHVDGGPGESAVSARMLGVVIYLNTVDVGGSTFFREHDIHVPAKRGSIAIFPANWTHPHQGCVPLSGDKWIVSTFILKPSQDGILETGNEHLL